MKRKTSAEQQERWERKVLCFLDKRQWRSKLTQRLLVTFLLAISTGLLLLLAHIQPSITQQLTNSHQVLAVTPSSLSPALRSTAQPHPLPPTLAQWQDPNDSGDYFSEVRQTEVDYLIWSQFPIKVYVEPAKAVSTTERSQSWVRDILQAVQEWAAYLPLEVVEQAEAADIAIRRIAPPLRTSPTGNMPRARSAETRYELYINNAATNPGILSHRCTILLSPNQISQYIQAAARHELGHALGIWGHSPVATDALYFSQVRHPLPISPRDINTLKRVYEQPTRLGWPL
ncbi:hypothetical protein [Chroococcidiopsis sp. CCMEE 29]|uniref:hypothetical protein n=1 Tax=Chroococcidiopsis sp. CCMEE 29 TaxID=155894 RepID=UPI00202144D9|nr:hypothetical protein [Chroococcidiopsis sp. CCMEE 29]